MDAQGRIESAAPGLDHEPLEWCPVCDLRAPWASAVMRCWSWRQGGETVTALVPDPTDALVDALLALQGENAAVEADELRMLRERGGK